MMKLMKYGMFAAATLLTIVLSAQSSKTLPDATVKTLDGKSVQIKSYVGKGKITILSFWATWCAPCKREIDAITEGDMDELIGALANEHQADLLASLGEDN